MADKKKTDSGWCAGKVVAVTGAARGIGKNIAARFAREGAKVVVCDLNAQGGGKAAADIGAQFLEVDLAKRGSPQEMVRAVVAKWGRLDVLVNNARSGERAAPFAETEEGWDVLMSVTLRAAFFASQEAVLAMSKTGGGVIVNVGSIAAEMVCAESPAYHIAKAGLEQMTRWFAVESGARGVRVNAVLPGFIVQDEHRARYDRQDNAEYRRLAEFCHPAGRVGTSDEVAEAVLFLASPGAGFITGECLVIDGGSTLQEQFGLLHRFSRQG